MSKMFLYVCKFSIHPSVGFVLASNNYWQKYQVLVIYRKYESAALNEQIKGQQSFLAKIYF